MEQKDPKDMTASELLRWAAENDKLRMRCDMCMKLYMMDSCGGHDCNDWLNDLADKIEADLAKARRGGLERCAKSWAEANGCPGFREGEGFGEWVNRCWLPIPRYKDGEPVDESDFGEDACLTVYGDGDWLINCSDGDQIEGSRSQRVERPAPEVLGADGLPIVEGDVVYELGRDDALTVYEVNAQYIHAKKESGAAWNNLTAEYLTHTPPVLAADGLPLREGETVWLTDEGARHAGDSDTMAEAGPYALCGIGANDRLTVKALPSRFHPNRVDLVEEGAWCPASWLTHTPPDSQERIDGDAQKSTLEYWGCRDASCECCPAETDGKTPRGRFDARNCQQAQMLDLLRRQRELDACKGGE